MSGLSGILFCREEREVKNMKKKIALLSLTVMMGLSVVACSNNKGNGDASASPNASGSPSASASAAPTMSPDEKKAIMEKDLSSYITLGQYKGIEITGYDTTVTDADVEKQITKTLVGKATVSEEAAAADYVAKVGDKLNIDYTGSVDGKEFEGGAATAQDIQIGNNTYIDGFGDALIGHKTGEEFDINVTFPEDYSQTDLAGKAAVFKIKINKIYEAKVPELTDAYAKELNEDVANVGEYKASVRKALEETAKSNKTTADQNAIWAAALEKATVSEYPEEQVSYYKDMITNQYSSMASQYGMTLSDYVTAIGKTMDEFDQSMEVNAKNYVKELMFMQNLAKVENLAVTDEEYQKGLNEYLEQVQLEDEQALIEALDETAPIQLRQSLLYEKVLNFLVDNAVIK